MIPRILAVLLLVPAIAGAEDVVFPATAPGPVVGPVSGPFVGPVVGPVIGPYDPYCPRHWIYDYLPAYDPLIDRYGVAYGYNGNGYDYLNRRYDNRSGLKAIPGRSTLEPAVPYSDYLANQRRLQAAVPPTLPTPAAVTPSADRAILEFTLPSDLARIWLNNQQVEGEGRTRTLHTPPLEPGREYKFTVKVTWPSTNPVEDHVSEQIVTFRAGERKPIEIRAKN